LVSGWFKSGLQKIIIDFFEKEAGLIPDKTVALPE